MTSNCYYCNATANLVTGSGRFAEYRGVQCELPEDCAVLVCSSPACNREWLGGDAIEKMSESFEKQRLAKCYTRDQISTIALVEGDRLFHPWTVGRPVRWTIDHRSRWLIVIEYLMHEELKKLDIDDEGRKAQVDVFHRHSRMESERDPCELAARLLNDAIAGKIDRDRKPHKRWG